MTTGIAVVVTNPCGCIRAAGNLAVKNHAVKNHAVKSHALPKAVAMRREATNAGPFRGPLSVRVRSRGRPADQAIVSGGSPRELRPRRRGTSGRRCRETRADLAGR